MAIAIGGFSYNWYTLTPNPALSAWSVRAAVELYEETHNPLHIMDAYCKAYSENVQLPPEATEWIFKAFSTYLESGGAKPIEEVLGLKRERGQASLFEKALNPARDSLFMWDLALLVALGASIERAAESVEALMRTRDWNISPTPLVDLSAATLRDRYVRNWKERMEALGARDVVASWSEQRRSEYLSEYPLTALPVELQRMVRKA